MEFNFQHFVKNELVEIHMELISGNVVKFLLTSSCFGIFFMVQKILNFFNVFILCVDHVATDIAGMRMIP